MVIKTRFKPDKAFQVCTIPVILARLSKSHMVRILILLILLGFAPALVAQKKSCTPTLPYTIKAESGIRMRAGPGTNHKVVVYVPAKSRVLVCEELDKPAEFENIKGHWRRVKYKSKYGYMFDGFLQKLDELPMVPTAAADFKIAQLLVINRVLEDDPEKMDSIMTYLKEVARINGYETLIGPAIPDSAFANQPAPKPKQTPIPALKFQLCKEAYNYCGDIEHLDPGKKWYAVYRQEDYFKLREIDLLIVRSKYSLSNALEFDIKTNKDLHSEFLISCSKPLDTNWFMLLPVEFFQQNPNKLYPGQTVEVYGKVPQTDLKNVHVFATGTVTDVGQCPIMENYQLKVNGEMHDKPITQDLTPAFSDLGECGIPELFWFGDLNLDGYPDLVFVSHGKTGMTFTLFVSDLNQQNRIYSKAFEWANLNCN